MCLSFVENKELDLRKLYVGSVLQLVNLKKLFQSSAGDGGSSMLALILVRVS